MTAAYLEADEERRSKAQQVVSWGATWVRNLIFVDLVGSGVKELGSAAGQHVLGMGPDK